MSDERRYTALLVSPSPRFDESILPLLSAQHISVPAKVSDAAAARRALLETVYDMVIIHAPLPDEFGTKLALDIAGSSNTGVLLFVRSDFYPDVNDRVASWGVLTISRPTASAFVAQSLSLLCATRELLSRMERKAAPVEEKMEEML